MISRFVSLSAAITACAMSIGVGIANAGGVQSDQLVITDQQGRTSVVPVGEPINIDGFEPPAVFNASNADPAGLASLVSLQPLFGFGPVGILVLLDPVGTVPGPGETAVQFGTTGQYVSDIVVALVDGANPVFGTTVALYSDPHPIFSDPFSVNLLTQGVLDFIVEDGTLQDITERMNLQSTTFTWRVQSDVGEVPIPAGAWLLGSALGLLGGWARRKTAA
jgi:hypothetical protein